MPLDKNTVRLFDARVSTAVSKLPDCTVKPLDILGYIFAPPMWMLYGFTYFLITRDSNGLLCVLLTPLGGFIKFVFRRKRPPTIYAGQMRIKSYSFPSSHAYSAALVAGYFAFVSEEILLSISFTALIFIMGISRVRLGAHYPSDVLAGWLLGLGLALLLVA